MKFLILDNYDSFTYNLVHYLEDILGFSPDVFRNDEIKIEAIANYDAILLSPGPGLPDDAGILKDVILEYYGKIPIFGVCLGLQAIVEVFGGELQNLNNVYHGVASTMTIINNDGFTFKNIPKQFKAGRYHSWVANPKKFPEELAITCIDENNNIMAIRHKKYVLEGVQFHPESILTPEGKKMLQNFVEAVELKLQ